jgi:hypothetical protein
MHAIIFAVANNAVGETVRMLHDGDHVVPKQVEFTCNSATVWQACTPHLSKYRSVHVRLQLPAVALAGFVLDCMLPGSLLRVGRHGPAISFLTTHVPYCKRHWGA